MANLSLAVLLSEAARRRPDHTAVVSDDSAGPGRHTYAELWRDALHCASALTARGVTPGDRVGLLCGNVPDFIRGYFGILAAGAVVVPVPTLLTGQEVGYLVSHSGAALLLHGPGLAELAHQGVGDTSVRVFPVATLLNDPVQPLRNAVTRRGEEPAVIFYTSGTTGRPKGAVLSHLNLVMGATVAAFDTRQLGEDEVVMGCLPLYHVYGQSIALNATFRVGATLLLQHRFDQSDALELMSREHATRFLGVPTMYVRLLDAARALGPEAALPRLLSCVSGGAPLPVELMRRFQERFDTTVFEGYGLSETTASGTVNQERFGVRAGTVGHPIWGVEVDIADAEIEGRVEIVPAGTTGEIVVRGHNVFSGYLNDPEATAAAMHDGWFRTGDIGRRDADGFISVLDRKKDLIIRGGYNVYPREIEEVLARHPAVSQVAVIGLPDETYGEEVCAIVVADEGADADQIRTWARERLGGHKYPRQVELVDELPLGPSHKVLKRELRAQFARKK